MTALRKIDVLDHGFVRLVSFMQPAANAPDPENPEKEDPDYSWTGDLEIVRNARVSYNADWRAGEDDGKDAKLVDYLLRNNHSTPFEAMVFTFEVKAPIFVLRQWHRHRTWSYNEVSARYAVLDEGYYVPAAEQITTQSTTNKQMRTNVQHPHAESLRGHINDVCEQATRNYNWLIQQGVPRELARTVLPVAAYSRMFSTVNLHNLFRFCRLRMHAHAQYEIRVYAEAMLALVEPVCPVAVKAFRAHG